MEKPNKECKNIGELKEEYHIYREKYSLPEFSELNKFFDIEEIDIETEFFLKRIRRIIVDRVVNYLRFIEVILNPGSSPMFFFKLIKKLDNKDREVLNFLYEELGKIEIDSLALDLEASEEKEAEFINKVYDIFNSRIKNELLEIIKRLNGNSETKKKENNGSYFG